MYSNYNNLCLLIKFTKINLKLQQFMKVVIQYRNQVMYNKFHNRLFKIVDLNSQYLINKLSLKLQIAILYRKIYIYINIIQKYITP